MGDVDVVDLLVAVERLIESHCDELDVLNVFPVPDADTGRNVLATVRSARVAAEQATPAERQQAAVLGALRGARGNAGALISQLLRALVEDVEEVEDDSWPARLARADDLARAAVAHPVEGSLLTAVRAAASAAAEHDHPGAQLGAAVAAAHAAVRDSPTLMEVLARAGVVDAGARAAALVLEAVAAVEAGTRPAPPAVEIPEGGPRVTACDLDDAPFEVMYLLEPDADGDVSAAVRSGLDRIGGSVVVVAADRLLSVHVHTDDIGAALDVGLAHGRPHHVRIEDLQEGQRDAAGRDGRSHDPPSTARGGLVVGAAGVGLARVAAEAGATTVPVGAAPPSVQDLRAAVARTGATRVVVLPGDPRVAAAARALQLEEVEVVVVEAVDSPARVLAALAVLVPDAPDVELLGEVAGHVRSGDVRRRGERDWMARTGDRQAAASTARDALEELLGMLGQEGTPELVSVLWGTDADVALRDAVWAAVERHWPDAEVELVDAGLDAATIAVGVE